MRRVLYDALIAAKSLDFICQSGKDYSAKEMAKASGLIMSRNLDDFFFKLVRDGNRAKRRAERPNPQNSYKKPDDIFVKDFGIRWSPPTSAMISESNYERINKLVGHIIAHSPVAFEDRDVCDIIKALVRAAVEFVKACLTSAQGYYTGKARFYVRRLNPILERIGIPQLPKPT
jgi:hypothetical protein